MPHPNLKLGALPARRSPALRDLEVYHAGPLPTPPAAVEPPICAYPMDGNDRLGDCTIAGVAHLIEAWRKRYLGSPIEVSAQAVERTYLTLTGGADSGLVELDVLTTWQRKGLLDEKIAGFAPIHPHNLLSLHQAVAFYGGAYLGIELPESAYGQFEADEPWTPVDGSPIEGGHCIVAVGYEKTGALRCVTWGKLVSVTPAFIARYCTEAWVILPHELVQRGADDYGLALETLQADLRRL
jgi:hypothetical protein